MRAPWMLLALVAGFSALAQPRGDPGKLMAEGEFERALKVLGAQISKARASAELGRLHLLKGQCHAALGQNAKAKAAFEKALRHDAEASLDPSVASPAMIELFERVRESVTGDLSVRAERTDGDVRIDGKPVGPPPLKMPVPVGRRRVELIVPGFLPSSKEVLVQAGKPAEIAFEASSLEPHSQVAPPLPGELAPAPPPSSVPAPGVPEPAEVARAAPKARTNLGPILLTSGGAALIVAGAVGATIAMDTKNRFDRQQEDPSLVDGAQGVTRAQASAAQMIWAGSLGSLAAGAALTTFGIIGLVAQRSEAVALVPLPGGAAATVSGRF
ncbi:MAG: PEGA domain-containing protein [Myxococcales bacterium]|nr:PEGA domain-containing protein [Myxococcales bacterium]